MIEELKHIETAMIDDLTEIRQERRVLDERLSKLEIEKGNKGISTLVYERIHKDYSAKISAFDQRAKPLREAARREYVKLRELFGRVEEVLNAKRLDREEIEVRHHLGEFDKKDFQKRTVEVDEILEKHQQGLDEINRVREKFVASFDSVDDLESVSDLESTADPKPVEPSIVEPPISESVSAGVSVQATRPTHAPAPHIALEVRPVDAPPAGVPLPKAGSSTGGEDGGTGQVEREYLDVEEPQSPTGVTVLLHHALPPSASLEDDDTCSSEPPFPESAATVPAVAVPPINQTGATVFISPPPPASFQEGATAMLPLAYLVPEESGFDAKALPVEPLSQIGRTSDHQIRIEDRTVSRNHAQVCLTPEGYVLKDLGSENGTYVNGQRIVERGLVDGDRVQIGTVRFIFQLGLPTSAG